MFKYSIEYPHYGPRRNRQVRRRDRKGGHFEAADANSFQDVLIDPRVRFPSLRTVRLCGRKKGVSRKGRQGRKENGDSAAVQIRFEVQTDPLPELKISLQIQADVVNWRLVSFGLPLFLSPVIQDFKS